jgi:hypothetical protein
VTSHGGRRGSERRPTGTANARPISAEMEQGSALPARTSVLFKKSEDGVEIRGRLLLDVCR